MAHGLNEDQTLAALTTTPARLLGVDAVLGTIEPGKSANLAVFDGSPFAKKTKLHSVWVNGRFMEIAAKSQFPIQGDIQLSIVDLGTWAGKVDADESMLEIIIELGKPQRVRKPIFTRDSVSFLFDGERLGLGDGLARFAGVVSGGKATGTVLASNGKEASFVIEPIAVATTTASQPTSSPSDATDEDAGIPCLSG